MRFEPIIPALPLFTGCPIKSELNCSLEFGRGYVEVFAADPGRLRIVVLPCFPLIGRPAKTERLRGADANRAVFPYPLDWMLGQPELHFAFRLAVCISGGDFRDQIKDLSVVRRAEEPQVFRMRPQQRIG